MIVRTWGGRVPVEHAERFHQHLIRTGVSDLRRQCGCHDVWLWRRDADGWAHFLFSSLWRDLDAVRGYAGESPEAAVLYEGDELFELVPDSTVTHYEVLSLADDGSPHHAHHRGHHPKPGGAPVPRKAMNSPGLAAPVGPFSHAVRVGELVYLSGQVGQDPVTGELVDGDVVQQSRQIFTNVRTLLDELGMSLDDVVKVNVLLVDMDDFAAVNEVYAQQFTAPYPARTTVAVKQLPLGALVEIEMIARVS